MEQTSTESPHAQYLLRPSEAKSPIKQTQKSVMWRHETIVHSIDPARNLTGIVEMRIRDPMRQRPERVYSSLDPTRRQLSPRLQHCQRLLVEIEMLPVRHHGAHAIAELQSPALVVPVNKGQRVIHCDSRFMQCDFDDKHPVIPKSKLLSVKNILDE